MNGRPITEDDLNAFVDQRLDPGRQAEVAAYLSAHPEIAARVEGYGRQRDQLRNLLMPIGEEPIPQGSMPGASRSDACVRLGRPGGYPPRLQS